MSALARKFILPTASAALPGRAEAVTVAPVNVVTGNPMSAPYPANMQQCSFGMGCFWGVEPLFFNLPGVYTTAAGFTGGLTPNPRYEEVCSGGTGHSEVVFVVYDPARISFGQLLDLFWESHNPRQGMRQGADLGTQFRSGIYASTDAQLRQAQASQMAHQRSISSRGLGPITTEIMIAPTFYFAENHHQQYLHKNPDGYCSQQGTDTSCIWTVPTHKSQPEARV
ncbi:peptide-methionine (S)-S-oxide reductase MsrA [Granulosicoccus antarcticus]|uniref:Peptide methionine sulfoxide reductase MsrA n=1 Tax=Granulosicoccus antarcticus IMCC3135 TaxID=1192854 RepID=A0A2Z2NJJ4_9GAMM|nr:peptide-methionine (S)-S-oxide reductase MsrA [Granulosicoccus antarcticus]ASJ71273.1 Peptide methionine sulfoxide reductase MsrA [Granulosicoccus antarcticus IMCC3135]